MAKKKKKVVRKKSPAAQAGKKVRTAFMSAFSKQFLNAAPGMVWPDPAQSEESVVTDFEMFTDVLTRAAYLLQPPVPDGTNSVRDRLAKFVIAQNWPVGGPVPKRFTKYQLSLRLIEISVITDRLLEAIDKFNGGKPGGSGSIWPPH